jgi:2-amino-4-hydroxy-6-hydroxymethyldihydropteridine diphosphokinase
VAEVAYIALGSNVGSRERYLANARTFLAALPASRVLAETAVEETAPIGPVEQGNYLNQMIALETSLTPATLLAELLRIERQLGRERTEPWGPRTIDLDIVLFGNRAVTTDELTIPHPELANRDFWQRELTELRGTWR